jgi:hypothetical protein
MKKIVALLCFSLFAFTGLTKAQTVMSPALDTITNTDTSYLALRINGAQPILTFQLDVTKLTGTTAGTATVQASLTGTSASYNDIKGSDTLTLTNASRSYQWVQPGSKFLYYRIRVLSTGTHTDQVKGFALFR